MRTIQALVQDLVLRLIRMGMVFEVVSLAYRIVCAVVRNPARGMFIASSAIPISTLTIEPFMDILNLKLLRKL